MHNMHKFLVLTIATSILLPLIVNAYAEEIPTFTTKVGEPKKITFKLTSNVDMQQPFVYIVQVKNEEDITIQLSWAQVMLQLDQEIRPQQSWIPDKPGEYTVDIFVWQSLDSPTALSPVLTMKVIVEP